MVSTFRWNRVPSYPVLFGLLGVLWGGSFVAIEVGLATVPPLLLAAVRYDVAAVAVVAYALATADRWRPRTRADVLAVATVGGLVVAGYQSLLFLGEQQVSGAVAAIVVSLSPVLTVGIAAAVVPGDGLGTTGYAGVALGFLGVLLVVDPTGGAASLTGLALVFGGAVCFASGSVLLRELDPALPDRSVQAWAMVLGALVLHLGSLARGETVPATWTPEAVGALAYLGVVSGAGAYLLYFELLDRVGASEVNLVAYVEPVVATALSWLLLGHHLDAGALAGFLVIFAGFGLVKHERALRLFRAGARTARRHIDAA